MATVSPSDVVPRAALEQCLRELPNYVVLRNAEDLLRHLQSGGDIDLLVDNMELAERTLIGRLGCPIRLTRHSYVREYFYDWGNVDLLPSIEWRGARFLRTETILDGRRVSESGRSVPRIAHEALISWLTSLLWGGFFKERYSSVIRQAVEVDGPVFRQTLLEVAGKTWGDRLWRAAAEGRPESSANWARSLRVALWWRACVTSPLHTIRRYFAFVAAELGLRFDPPVPSIAIVGPDGNRRSALVNELVQRFSLCPYARARSVAWRPRRGPLTLLTSAADWLMAYWTRCADLRAKGYILAFDRTYFDLVVDRIGRSFGQHLASSLWRLLPKPDLVFALDSPPVPAHLTREVRPLEVPRQPGIERGPLTKLSAGHVLNGSVPLSVLADEIERVIRAWTSERAAATLGFVQTPMAATPGISAESSSRAPHVIEPRRAR